MTCIIRWTRAKRCQQPQKKKTTTKRSAASVRRDAAWGGPPYLGRGRGQQLAQQEHPKRREHLHGSAARTHKHESEPEKKRYIPGSRCSLTAPPRRSFLNPTARSSWMDLLSWFQINPSLQPKGLNSMRRTVHGGEGVREEGVRGWGRRGGQ